MRLQNPPVLPGQPLLLPGKKLGSRRGSQRAQLCRGLKCLRGRRDADAIRHSEATARGAATPLSRVFACVINEPRRWYTRPKSDAPSREAAGNCFAASTVAWRAGASLQPPQKPRQPPGRPLQTPAPAAVRPMGSAAGCLLGPRKRRHRRLDRAQRDLGGPSPAAE